MGAKQHRGFVTDLGIGGVGLANGTAYYHAVRAGGPGGDSAQSLSRTASPSKKIALRINSGGAESGDFLGESFVSGGDQVYVP